MSVQVEQQASDNLLIVKTSDMGHIAQLNLFRDREKIGIDSLIELTPYFSAGIDENEAEQMSYLYISFLRTFQERGYGGVIQFIKEGRFTTDTGCRIEDILTKKLNEIFKYIVVRRAIAIEDFELDFEDLYKLKDQIKEVSEGLEIFDKWLKTQFVLYTEEWKAAKEMCHLDPGIKEHYPELNLMTFPILNCVSFGLPIEVRPNVRKDLIETIIKSELYTVTNDKEPRLYAELEGFYTDKDKFFNILREMYIFVHSPYNYLGGLFKFKVYRTLDGNYNIVNCRTY